MKPVLERLYLWEKNNKDYFYCLLSLTNVNMEVEHKVAMAFIKSITNQDFIIFNSIEKHLDWIRSVVDGFFEDYVKNNNDRFHWNYVATIKKYRRCMEQLCYITETDDHKTKSRIVYHLSEWDSLKRCKQKIDEFAGENR